MKRRLFVCLIEYNRQAVRILVVAGIVRVLLSDFSDASGRKKGFQRVFERFPSVFSTPKKPFRSQIEAHNAKNEALASQDGMIKTKRFPLILSLL
jgi:hypothetical protein